MKFFLVYSYLGMACLSILSDCSLKSIQLRSAALKGEEGVDRSWYRVTSDVHETPIVIPVSHLLNPEFYYFQLLDTGVVASAYVMWKGSQKSWGPEVLEWAPSRVGISLTLITAVLLPSCPLYLLLNGGQEGVGCRQLGRFG